MTMLCWDDTLPLLEQVIHLMQRKLGGGQGGGDR